MALPLFTNTRNDAKRPHSTNSSPVSWSKDEIVGLLSTNKIDLDPMVDVESINMNRLFITGVGLKECYHAAGKFERCSTKVPHGLPKVHFKDEMLEVVIPKDLRGSIGFHWYGNSEYLSFNAMSMGSLLKSQVKELYALVDVTSAPFPNKSLVSVHVHNVYFVFQKFTLESLLSKPVQGHTVSNINVLFGSDCKDPRDLWHLFKSKPLLDRYRFPSYISYEKKSIVGSSSSSVYPPLVVQPGKNFKIVQLADLHMGVGENKCLDEYPATENCHADPKTFQFIDAVLNIEKPDMVVFTGDQIMGDRSIQDSESTLLKVLDPVI